MTNETTVKPSPRKKPQAQVETLTVNIKMTVPPSPYTSWSEDALKAYAEARGFKFNSSTINERDIANIKGVKV